MAAEMSGGIGSCKSHGLHGRSCRSGALGSKVTLPRSPCVWTLNGENSGA